MHSWKIEVLGVDQSSEKWRSELDTDLPKQKLVFDSDVVRSRTDQNYCALWYSLGTFLRPKVAIRITWQERVAGRSSIVHSQGLRDLLGRASTSTITEQTCDCWGHCFQAQKESRFICFFLINPHHWVWQNYPLSCLDNSLSLIQAWFGWYCYFLPQFSPHANVFWECIWQNNVLAKKPFASNSNEPGIEWRCLFSLGSMEHGQLILCFVGVLWLNLQGVGQLGSEILCLVSKLTDWKMFHPLGLFCRWFCTFTNSITINKRTIKDHHKRNMFGRIMATFVVVATWTMEVRRPHRWEKGESSSQHHRTHRPFDGGWCWENPFKMMWIFHCRLMPIWFAHSHGCHICPPWSNNSVGHIGGYSLAGSLGMASEICGFGWSMLI